MLSQASQIMGLMLVPILIGLAVTFCLEQAHSPRPHPAWQRHPTDLLLHAGLWLLLYLLEFIQFRRPWLALCLSSTIFYVLVLINHAKYRALREPFIYQDLEYFLDALKHPRLYLPFFGFWKIALCLAGVCAALWVGVSVEQPLTSTFSSEQVWLACTGLLFLATILLLAGNLRKATLRFKPAQDFEVQGLLAMLWRYARAERNTPVPVVLGMNSTLKRAERQVAVEQSPAMPSTQSLNRAILPDTVVVQSESFFDPRRVFSNIEPTVLAAFDQACQASVKFGTLRVPAWGANTVRTEFEFLTGLDTSSLGIDQFNPYRRLVQQDVPSIAHEFKNRGYRTICVHPYPASFYQRDKIFPLLGFDEFIDIKSFAQTSHTSKQCPYISDARLTSKVLALLDQKNDQPLFIFVITMENHGPLHLETLSTAESTKWLKQPLPPACSDLPVYLRHLANADQMISRLIERLSVSTQGSSTLGSSTQGSSALGCSTQGSRSQRPGQLLWYGDHVPVLPAVYDKLGMPDGQTDYFLWRSYDSDKDSLLEQQQTKSGPLHKSPEALVVHQLAAELLK